MPTVTMPDGTAVEMPDQLDAATGARLRQFQTAKAAPPAAAPQADPSFLQQIMGHVGDFIKNMPMVQTADAALQVGNRAVVKPAVGAAADLLSGGRPGARESAESAVELQPHTGMGAAVPAVGGMLSRAVAPVLAPVADAYHRGIDSLQEAHPLAGALLENAGRVAGDVAAITPATGAAKTGLRAFDEAGVAARANAPTIAAHVPAAIDEGWNIRPSDARVAAGGADVPGIRRQKLQNGPDLQNEMILKNQAKATRDAGADIGVKNASDLQPETFEKLREPHNKNYETAGAAAGDFTDQTLGKRLAAIAKDVSPEDNMRADVLSIGADYIDGPLNGEKLVGSIQKLRREASRGIQSEVPKAQEIGYAKKKIADALEESLGNQLDALGDKQVFTAFQDSRQALAKIHNVEDATVGGQVDPQILARLKKRGAMLTGPLDNIATRAEQFPDVVRHAQRTASSGMTQIQVNKGLIHSAVDKTLSKIPGMDVSTPGFQQKIAKTARGQIAERGANQNIVKPVEPVRSNQGRQTDMLGDILDLAASGKIDPRLVKPQLGEQIDALGSHLDLEHAPGTAERPPMGPSPTRQELLLGDQLDLIGKKANAPKRPIANYRAKGK